MKKILIVILESTILTLFFTAMSQASMSINSQDQSALNCRSTLTNLQKCAQQTAIAEAMRLPMDQSGNVLRVSP